jgi:hypothetical protein
MQKIAFILPLPSFGVKRTRLKTTQARSYEGAGGCDKSVMYIIPPPPLPLSRLI